MRADLLRQLRMGAAAEDGDVPHSRQDTATPGRARSLATRHGRMGRVTEPLLDPDGMALLDSDGMSRLRTALTTAGYTANGIAARLGPAATGARGPERLPRRRCAPPPGRDPLAHADPAVHLRPDRARSRPSPPRSPRCRSPRRWPPASSSGTATGCGPASTWSRTATAGSCPMSTSGQRPGRPAAARPRARRRRRVHHAGRGDHPPAGRHRARPGHRLRGTGPAPVHPRRPGHRDRPVRPARCASPPPPPPSTAWTGSCCAATWPPRSPAAASTWWSATRRSWSGRAPPRTATATPAGPATRSAPSWPPPRRAC